MRAAREAGVRYRRQGLRKRKSSSDGLRDLKLEVVPQDGGVQTPSPFTGWLNKIASSLGLSYFFHQSNSGKSSKSSELKAARLRDFYQFEWATNRQNNLLIVALVVIINLTYQGSICWERARRGWRHATVPLLFHSCTAGYQLFVSFLVIFQYTRSTLWVCSLNFILDISSLAQIINFLMCAAATPDNLSWLAGVLSSADCNCVSQGGLPVMVFVPIFLSMAKLFVKPSCINKNRWHLCVPIVLHLLVCGFVSLFFKHSTVGLAKNGAAAALQGHFVTGKFEFCVLILSVGSLLLITVVSANNKSLKMFKMLQKQARDAEMLTREKEVTKKFVAYLFHEVRVPLNVVSMGLPLILQDISTGRSTRNHSAPHVLTARQHEKATETVRSIEQSVVQVSRILDDVLDLAKVEEGKLQMRFKWVDVKDFIQGVANAMAPVLHAHGINFLVHFNGCGGSPGDALMQDTRVYLDPQRITQVVNNLISNAVKATPKGGRVMLIIVAERLQDVLMAPQNNHSSSGSSSEYMISLMHTLGLKHPEGKGQQRVSDERERDAFWKRYQSASMKSLGARLDGTRNSISKETDGSEDQQSHLMRNTQVLSSSLSEDAAKIPAQEILLTIKVQDSGTGIAHSDAANLFQPFEQAASEETPLPGKGTGLGLALARLLVRLHCGELTLDHSSPMEGSTFSARMQLYSYGTAELYAAQQRIQQWQQEMQQQQHNQPGFSDGHGGSRGTTLIDDNQSGYQAVLAEEVPRLDRRAGQSRRRSSAQACAESAGATRILVVDDARLNRVMLCRQLQALGFETDEAVDGIDCLQKWNEMQQRLNGNTTHSSSDDEDPSPDNNNRPGGHNSGDMRARRRRRRSLERYGKGVAEGAEAVVFGEDGGGASSVRSPYCCIFMDRNMPRQGGEEATRNLRVTGCRIPIVGISGDALGDHGCIFKESGLTAMLTKPVTKDMLIDCLVNVGVLQRAQESGTPSNISSGMKSVGDMSHWNMNTL